MKQKIGGVLATVIGLILLVYSAFRSYDFVVLTLPPDKAIVGYFALAALDGGIIAWLLSYLYGSNNSWQRSIALVMVIIDFLGAVVMFSLDTIYNAGQAGLVQQLDANTLQTAMLALSGIIAINIGATIGHHLLDPEVLRRQAEEEARATIEEQALKLIAQDAPRLAAEVAPQVASAWRESMTIEYGHRLKKVRTPKTLPATVEEPPIEAEQVPATNPTTRRKSKD